MGFIYCIRNKVNGKQYIGKTTKTVEERFNQHKQECQKERCEKRPLYDAMHKYGVENFTIEKILECDNSLLSEKEQEYIEKYQTFHYGYNATKGGDGSIIFDSKNIIDTYKNSKHMAEAASKIGCSIDTIRNALDANQVPIKQVITGSCNAPCSIIQIQEDKKINTFKSIADASKWLVENNYTNRSLSSLRATLSKCKRGIQKHAFGFKWV